MQKKQAGNNRIYHSAIVCLFFSFLGTTKDLFWHYLLKLRTNAVRAALFVCVYEDFLYFGLSP